MLTSKPLSRLKVALVHDWLINGGGAERQLATIAELFPDSPIYTSAWRPEESLPVFKRRDIRVGWPGRLPLLGRYHRLGVFFRYLYWSRLKLDGYDLVISSSGSEAKGIRTGPDQLHINICYSPPHYYWSHYRQYLRSPGLGLASWPARLVLLLLIRPLRALDRRAAARPDRMVAISNIVAERIKRYYGRDSTVIFPPVELPPPGRPKAGPRRGYVALGRHVAYKNLDLAVLACQQTFRNLTVIGQGPDSRRLKRLARARTGLIRRPGQTINFTGQISEADKRRRLAAARACLFPGIDDFGMVVVEALAAGTPVIALEAGGAVDIVRPDCGLFFRRPTVESLIGALDRFEKIEFDPPAARRRARSFSAAVFKTKFQRYLTKSWQEFNATRSHRN